MLQTAYERSMHSEAKLTDSHKHYNLTKQRYLKTKETQLLLLDTNSVPPLLTLAETTN